MKMRNIWIRIILIEKQDFFENGILHIVKIYYKLKISKYYI